MVHHLTLISIFKSILYLFLKIKIKCPIFSITEPPLSDAIHSFCTLNLVKLDILTRIMTFLNRSQVGETLTISHRKQLYTSVTVEGSE